jgi:diguanylate cyclase (GGDEF)-like protein
VVLAVSGTTLIGTPAAETTTQILMVEDDLGYAALIAALLEDVSALGPVEITAVASIGAALEALEDQEPTVILLDLGLPDADGLDGLLVLRSAWPALPIVILTAREDELTGVAAMAVGAQDYLTKADVDGRALLRAVRYAIERHKAEERLQRTLLFDNLTGLPGRVLLLDRLELALERRQRNHGSVAVLLVDIDDFGYVNNAFGHATGDHLLVEVAERLAGVLRPADTVGRLGSDEFVVLYEELRDDGGVMRMAERMAEAVAVPFELPNRALRVTPSIGIALAQSDETTAEQMMREAATAAANAKSRPGTSVAVFDEGMRDRSLRMVTLTADLHEAIAHDELTLHYQPLVDLQTGRLHALEALVRWPRARAGTRMPESFIPAAERSGLIVPLGGWVLDRACREMARWRAEGLAPGVRMSVNVSGAQLRAGDLPERLASAINASGLDPEDLTLELTESTVMLGDDETEQAVAGIRALGHKVAMDDFGTGFAALATLIEMHFDEVKIDRLFIAAMAHDDRPVIVRPVLRLAQDLGIETVCEGIETRHQLRVLRDAGARVGQGFLFGRSVAPEEAEHWLAPGFRFDVSAD